MSTSNRSSAAAATAIAARSEASAATPANRSTPDRQRFALASPSRALDHRLNAARRDLADIALAGHWFAPHYVVPEKLRCGPLGTDLLAEPKGGRISQLLPGEQFAVVESSGGWAWGYSVHDRYVGYIPAETLISEASASHVVIARTALAFSAPSSRAEVQAELPMGSRLAGDVQDDFLLTDIGFVPRQQLSPVDVLDEDPVRVAERMAGAPYLWGGRGIGGIDCSGLVQLAFGLSGFVLPRDSDMQIAAGAAAEGALRKGDLLFFPDHVVILSAPDRAIHASGYWMAVVEEPLADIVARMGEPVARRRVLP